MSSKRMFSWSKRQSYSEPYYRTGGLLPIEANGTAPSNDFDLKTTPKAKRRRPSTLKIVPPDNKQYVFTPASSPRNAALVNAANSLQAALNDMLRSPAPNSAAFTRSASLEKPLPDRPRSASVSSTPELPELPGSLLLENQGFPSLITPISARPTSQTTRRETHPPDNIIEDERYQTYALNLAPAPLAHTKSVPDLSARSSTMRSVRSGHALNPNAAPRSISLNAQHKKSLSEANARRRSRPNLVTSPSSTASKPTRSSDSTIKHNDNNNATGRSLQSAPPISEGWAYDLEAERRQSYRNQPGASFTPTSTNTRSKHIEELNASISTQDETISTLQAQFGNLRASHEAHIASITESHSAEVASLKNYVPVLEEQARKSNLHDDTTEPPQTPTREVLQNTTGPDSAGTTASSPGVLDKQQQSPRRVQNSPDMENLKRKLSTSRRPESTSRNLLPELNQYKQNNVALQKQIESLMAKLNHSKKNERDLRNTLGAGEQRCAELEDKAGQADKLAKTMQALQNTISHLESRLEIANTERLDVEEQLFNMLDKKSFFDLPLPRSQTQDAHVSTSTVFSDPSSTSSETESQENSTLTAFVAHIERLQDQVREKDTYITELEDDRDQLRERKVQLEQERDSVILQSDIQEELLRKSQHADTHIERLRAAVTERESIIEEKAKTVRAVERQLEQHKLLLQAEIRRHATMKLHAAVEEDPLPELSSLAKKEDIDRWINRLNERLKRERGRGQREDVTSASDSQVESLRQEIDFYVREIIYFKLDIKGYKSDIRKLKKLTIAMSNYGSRNSDLDSDTSSLRPIGTPSGSRLASAMSDFSASNTASMIARDPVLAQAAEESSFMSSPSVQKTQSSYTRTTPTKSSSKVVPQQFDLDSPTLPQSLIYQYNSDMPDRMDRPNLNTFSRSAAPQSPDPRKPEPLLPRQEKPDDHMTRFPLGKPAVTSRPVDHKRSMSESTLQLSSTPGTPEWSTAILKDAKLGTSGHAVVTRDRSASVSEASKGRPTPRRPPRPHDGLSGIHPATSGEQTADSVSSTSQRILRSRTGSVSSTTNNYATQPPPSPERKLSAASSTALPFAPTAPGPRSSCSITRYAPLQARPSTGRTGIGGTMCSSTPIASPVQHARTLSLEEEPAPTRKQSRKAKKLEDKLSRAPSHSRSISECSIRTAIRLTRKGSQGKEKEKDGEREKKGEGGLLGKESISGPRPVDGGGGMEFEDGAFMRETVGEEGRGKGGVEKSGGYGVGEAM